MRSVHATWTGAVHRNSYCWCLRYMAFLMGRTCWSSTIMVHKGGGCYERRVAAACAGSVAANAIIFGCPMAGGVLGSLWRGNRSFSSSCGCKEHGCVQEGASWHPRARQDACVPEQFQDRSEVWPGVIYTSANVMKWQGAPHEATGARSSCHLDCASVLPQAVQF